MPSRKHGKCFISKTKFYSNCNISKWMKKRVKIYLVKNFIETYRWAWSGVHVPALLGQIWPDRYQMFKRMNENGNSGHSYLRILHRNINFVIATIFWRVLSQFKVKLYDWTLHLAVYHLMFKGLQSLTINHQLFFRLLQPISQWKSFSSCYAMLFIFIIS